MGAQMRGLTPHGVSAAGAGGLAWGSPGGVWPYLPRTRPLGLSAWAGTSDGFQMWASHLGPPSAGCLFEQRTASTQRAPRSGDGCQALASRGVSAQQTLIRASGREAAERGGPRGPREATRPALSRGAVASLPGLERRPPTSGRVEFCTGVRGTSPFGTPTPGPLCFPPRLMPHTLRTYFRNTGFYNFTVRGPLVVPRPPWTHAFLHAQARGEHVPHWVGDTELQGPVSSRLWRRTGKRCSLEQNPLLLCPQPHPGP